MLYNLIPVASKGSWSRLIWERANWRASNLILNDNDLLCSIIKDTHYLSWWRISDLDYRLTNMCETMSKIICHASMLKRDDYRLKGLQMSDRTCIHCDLYRIEDIIHIITQCPHYQAEFNDLVKEIHRKWPKAMQIFNDNQQDIVYYLLGMNIPGFEDNEMIELWTISGNVISRVYKNLTMGREGVG